MSPWSIWGQCLLSVSFSLPHGIRMTWSSLAGRPLRIDSERFQGLVVPFVKSLDALEARGLESVSSIPIGINILGGEWHEDGRDRRI